MARHGVMRPNQQAMRAHEGTAAQVRQWQVGRTMGKKPLLFNATTHVTTLSKTVRQHDNAAAMMLQYMRRNAPHGMRRARPVKTVRTECHTRGYHN